MKEIKFTEEEMRFLLYALRGYQTRLGVNRKHDDFYERLFRNFSNDLGECARIERKLFKKIAKRCL